MRYESVNNDKIKMLKKLHEKKYRDEYGLFLVEGEHLILEAFKFGYLKEIYILDGCELDVSIDYNFISENVMNYLSKLVNNKFIGLCIKKDKLIDFDKNILVLDGIQDPGNLGTIIRSALAFNFNNIVLSNDSVDLYNEKVVRATQGGIFKINFLRVNLDDFIIECKSNGYTIYGTDVTNGKSVKCIKDKKNKVIIMGNEGSGIKESILKLCDEFVYIDMNVDVESLNVGVAASILMYEMR